MQPGQNRMGVAFKRFVFKKGRPSENAIGFLRLNSFLCFNLV